MAADYSKLCAWRFGFAWGAIWALGMLFMGWTAWLWGYGSELVKLLGHGYLGYAPSFGGGILGALWGFVDFFIFAWLVALVYNSSCLCRKAPSESSL